MTIYHWILLIAFGIFIISGVVLFLQVIVNKGKKDFAPARGSVSRAIVYSFTGAMSPFKKETAYFHLPTYTAGMLFHIGTFISFFWLILLFSNVQVTQWIIYASSLLIFVTGICGLSIFIKRLILARLRSLSNPDDYFSNLLVTGFQFGTAITILRNEMLPFLFIYSAVLLLYIPVSKLRHTIYFFTSRIHLGMFYGKRGAWPVKKVINHGK